ncbi:uncharacterized protein MONBRDRAFT_34038 [Monosiga brevicollis MX1]|uniref:Uncharacterized protein n=1 Tax=Monosiga brevicollis TaxID=81824 RepID=A9V9I2_MONBE|nr:uncharacterized protein MONBRDRAFT_34038 [Monosiga brevicollis MX1]EDQ85799.1 predicted protein [Monosiga brevicollis MX1]|eukprot:XP_001749278.1 hypothetical protein [Monosiga brevicollis MX1]
MDCLLCGGAYAQMNSEDRARTRQIDAQLRKEARAAAGKVKLLLLGTGECGKSTVLKQLRILHGHGFSEQERRGLRLLVHQNLMMSMAAILEALWRKGHLSQADIEAEAKKFVLDYRSNRLQRAPMDLMRKLWADDVVQATMLLGHTFQLPDNTKYMFEQLDRIADPDYVPTVQDVLHTRFATTGIIEYHFQTPEARLVVIDVGGQRSQRRKWIQCFDDVSSVIFITSISEYDQVLAEDHRTNRMAESINLFRALIQEPSFRNSSIIVFLNKRDLLEAKLQAGQTRIRDFFPRYSGDEQNVDEVIAFFREEFILIAAQANRQIFVHVTCATDTELFAKVFNDTRTTIVRQHLQRYDLL